MSTDIEWFPMDKPMTFPALVQFENGECRIIKDELAAAAIRLHDAIRWRPWVNPELPMPEAFDQWWAKQSCQHIDPKWTAWYCWLEAQFQATAAERSRFAEGVEKLIEKWRTDMAKGVIIASDLRALVKGDKSTQ